MHWILLFPAGQLQDIVHDPNLDRGHKARQLRIYLRQRRFPQIVEAESRFEYLRKQLDLGNDLKMIPPKDFEGTTYTVSMSFSSIAQLKALHAKLNRMITHPGLQKILERKNNTPNNKWINITWQILSNICR